MADPNLEVCPDFTSNAFREVREALMDALHIDVAHAIDRLVAAWDADYNHWIEDWNAQCEAEALEADHLWHEEQEREDEARRLEEAEAVISMILPSQLRSSGTPPHLRTFAPPNSELGKSPLVSSVLSPLVPLHSFL